jgi:UDP-glucuronate 4-epimerase
VQASPLADTGHAHGRRALVTGAAGFIGSHIVDALLAAGWQVTGVDNFDPFYARDIKVDNIAGHRDQPRWRFVEVDVAEPRQLETVDGSFDVIVHLAAKVAVRPSILDPQAYQRANVTGTQNLLELARVRGVPQFVFASSSSVYGVNADVPWSEADHVLLPISPYASSKVSGELLGHVYAHLYGVRFLALRFFTVYGPRQRPDLAIHKFARRMLVDEPIQMFGDGSTRRDYTFVSDIVAGVMSAVAYRGSLYEVINLGNDRTVSLRDMIGELERVLGVRARIERLPEQAGDVPQTWASLEKARALLGYDPQVPLARGVEYFVEWLRARHETARSI